jgi:putative N6-adenine-specific DNA methylase
MFAYQRSHRYFAQITDGTEELASAEVAALGATDVKPGYRGLYFTADDAALYRVNYAARLVTRVFAPLETFDCHSAKYLYQRAREIPWDDIFTVDQTFAVHANVSNSAIRHSQYAALRVKDAIADRFRDARGGRRPNVRPHDPDVGVNLYVHNNSATISVETSGGSMHRRGYRSATVTAPMQETVAAAAIAMTGWDGETPLVDPMCGSGTLLAEALMRYCRIPSGYLRGRFGFESLPGFDAEAWRTVKRELDGDIRPLPAGLVSGSDASAEAVRAASTNCRVLPGGERVNVVKRPFEAIERIENSTIVCNPPYGLRMGRADAMPEFMKSFGDFLKRRCAGSTAYVYVGHRELLKHVGLKTAWKKPLPSGGLDGRFVKYELY